MPLVGVLDHHQSVDERIRTFIPSETAKELVRRLIAEKLSKRVIRLFSPDSPFPTLKPKVVPKWYIPDKLPGKELPGVFFREPQSDEWKRNQLTVTVPRLHVLPRWREVIELGQ